MAVAFIGTHIPLLTLVITFALSPTSSSDVSIRVLAIALTTTLVGTAFTLCALHYLLAPVVLTARSLRAYIDDQTLPNLPTEFTDEVGVLMSSASQTIHKLDEVIRYMASYDALTGLPNQTLLSDRLQQEIIQAQKNHQSLAITSFSISNLAEVYNVFGKEISESLLRAFAQRLGLKFSESVIFAYLSGSLFIAVQSSPDASGVGATLTQTILDAINDRFVINGEEIYVSTNVGISLYPHDSSEINQLLQNARAAMDTAQKLGKNTYQFYAPEMNARLQEHLSLENELRHAIPRNELQLHYQPRVSAQSGQLLAVEALLRWRSPTRDSVSPKKFIPIAEDSDLILPIGEWVLRKACHQNRLWQDAGFPPVRMAVNLSARQLKQDNFVTLVRDILADTGLDAASLELEVTESLMMDDLQRSIQILLELRDLGVTLALDDFGTGYSSLSYLRHFPVDTLKIDQSFVRNIMSNLGDAAITKTIITLAQNLHLNITAEGVETQEQFEYIKNQGCNEIQGDYLSCPIPAENMAELLQNGVPVPHQTIIHT